MTSVWLELLLRYQTERNDFIYEEEEACQTNGLCFSLHSFMLIVTNKDEKKFKALG